MSPANFEVNLNPTVTFPPLSLSLSLGGKEVSDLPSVDTQPVAKKIHFIYTENNSEIY